MTKNQIGWIGSFIGAGMYLSQMSQIALNLSGNKGSLILPAVTTINAIIWVIYGLKSEKKEWPIVICNIIGIITGLITTITAII